MTTDNFGSDAAQFGEPALDETAKGAPSVVSRVTDKAKNLGRDAVSAIDAQRAPLANTMSSAADSLQSGGEKASHLVQGAGDTAGRLAQDAADKLQAGAEFVRDHDLNAMMASVERYVRQNPGKALLIAGFVGFLSARALRTD